MNPKTVRIDTLSADQIGMLKIFGNPPEEVERLRMSYYVTPDACEEPFEPYVGDFACPVIAVGGKLRMILPGGDLSTVDLDHIAEWEKRQADTAAIAERAVEMEALGIPMIQPATD